MARLMLADADDRHKAETKWAQAILSGAISHPNTRDASDYFAITRYMLDQNNQHYQNRPETAPAVSPDRKQGQTLSVMIHIDGCPEASGPVWYIQRLDNLQIGPSGWRIGDRILISGKALNPQYNNFIAIPHGMMPGDCEVDPFWGAKYHGGQVADHLAWYRVEGTRPRDRTDSVELINEIWMLRVSHEWLNSNGIHRPRIGPARAEDALVASAPAEAVVASVPAAALAVSAPADPALDVDEGIEDRGRDLRELAGEILADLAARRDAASDAAFEAASGPTSSPFPAVQR